jgi:hypothetical protein
MLAPIALRLAERCSLDRRMIGLMVLHGSACGNFSPLNALGVIVLQGAARNGFEVSAASVFLANVGYNVVLERRSSSGSAACSPASAPGHRRRWKSRMRSSLRRRPAWLMSPR